LSQGPAMLMWSVVHLPLTYGRACRAGNEHVESGAGEEWRPGAQQILWCLKLLEASKERLQIWEASATHLTLGCDMPCFYLAHCVYTSAEIHNNTALCPSGPPPAGPPELAIQHTRAHTLRMCRTKAAICTVGTLIRTTASLMSCPFQALNGSSICRS
jgi:hypothetical protein